MKRALLSEIGCIAIAMAVYAGIWTALTNFLSLPGWIGFAGCTTYFAVGKKGIDGFKQAVAVNTSGFFWALFALFLGSLFPGAANIAIYSSIISYTIIMQSKLKILNYIPGAYIGCFVVFGASASKPVILVMLISGALMGVITEYSAGVAHSLIWNGSNKRAVESSGV